MARLHTIGFELNSMTYETDAYSGATISNTQARTGTYSLLLDSTNEYATYDVPTATTELYMGFGVHNTGSSIVYIPTFRGLGTTFFDVRIDPGRTISMYRGTTRVATSSNHLTGGGWSYIEIYYKPSDTVGVCTVKVNGTQWVTFSGDTKNSSQDLDQVVFNGGTGCTCYIDDLIINDSTGGSIDTWPGIHQLEIATVNGNGTAIAWTPSAGNNYECVDEVPPNTTDYVSATSGDGQEGYEITDPTAGTDTVYYVAENILAKVDSGSALIKAYQYSLALGWVTGDDINLTETWTMYQQFWETDPGTGAWSQADIAALQVGQSFPP